MWLLSIDIKSTRCNKHWWGLNFYFKFHGKLSIFKTNGCRDDFTSMFNKPLFRYGVTYCMTDCCYGRFQIKQEDKIQLVPKPANSFLMGWIPLLIPAATFTPGVLYLVWISSNLLFKPVSVLLTRFLYHIILPDMQSQITCILQSSYARNPHLSFLFGIFWLKVMFSLPNLSVQLK